MKKVQQIAALGAALAVGAIAASALPALAAEAAAGWTPAGGTSNAAFFLNAEKSRVTACRIRPGTSLFAVECSTSVPLPSS